MADLKPYTVLPPIQPNDLDAYSRGFYDLRAGKCVVYRKPDGTLVWDVNDIPQEWINNYIQGQEAAKQEMEGESARSIKLSDFLTNPQIRKCLSLYPDRQQIRDQVIQPNMADINAKLGQDNDPDYLSYAVVYAISVHAGQAKATV